MSLITRPSASSSVSISSSALMDSMGSSQPVFQVSPQILSRQYQQQQQQQQQFSDLETHLIIQKEQQRTCIQKQQQQQRQLLYHHRLHKQKLLSYQQEPWRQSTGMEDRRRGQALPQVWAKDEGVTDGDSQWSVVGSEVHPTVHTITTAATSTPDAADATAGETGQSLPEGGEAVNTNEGSRNVGLVDDIWRMIFYILARDCKDLGRCIQVNRRFH
ncbi:hypothetical protein BGZ65_002219, partial [Modicella reniformis]